jgi:hypothetical protein
VRTHIEASRPVQGSASFLVCPYGRELGNSLVSALEEVICVVEAQCGLAHNGACLCLALMLVRVHKGRLTLADLLLCRTCVP